MDDDAPEEENGGQATSSQQTESVDYMSVQKSGQEEKAADAPMPYPVENARHSHATGGINPQGQKLTDKPAQKESLKEKLEAYKLRAAGGGKLENNREKRKEEIR